MMRCNPTPTALSFCSEERRNDKCCLAWLRSDDLLGFWLITLAEGGMLAHTRLLCLEKGG
jgi:hypothetical protein